MRCVTPLSLEEYHLNLEPQRGPPVVLVGTTPLRKPTQNNTHFYPVMQCVRLADDDDLLLPKKFEVFFFFVALAGSTSFGQRTAAAAAVAAAVACVLLRFFFYDW